MNTIKMKSMKKVISLILLMGTLYMSAQESALLRYNLNKGDAYEITLSLKQDMAPILNMDITMSMVLKSLGKEGTNLKSSYKFKKMALRMAAAGEEVKFDSDDKDEDLNEEAKKMKTEMAPILNMTMIQTIDKYGKIIDVKFDPIVTGANQMMDQAQFTNMTYPEKAVKVGSKWSYKQNISGMSVDATYTVTKITKNRVYADLSGNIGSDGLSKISGKTEIDSASGMILDMTLDMIMSQGGMDMKMNIHMESKKVK